MPRIVVGGFFGRDAAHPFDGVSFTSEWYAQWATACGFPRLCLGPIKIRDDVCTPADLCVLRAFAPDVALLRGSPEHIGAFQAVLRAAAPAARLLAIIPFWGTPPIFTDVDIICTPIGAYAEALRARGFEVYHVPYPIQQLQTFQAHSEIATLQAAGYRVVVYAGRFGVGKQLAPFVAEWYRTAPDSWCLWLGGVAETPMARPVVHDRDLRVVYHERHISRLELSQLFGTADAFVFPSLRETFGITPLEAIAAGCPCVTFRGPDPSLYATTAWQGRYIASMGELPMHTYPWAVNGIEIDNAAMRYADIFAALAAVLRDPGAARRRAVAWRDGVALLAYMGEAAVSRRLREVLVNANVFAD